MSRFQTRLLQADRGEPVELEALTHGQPPRFELPGRHGPFLGAIERADGYLLAALDRDYPKRLALRRLDRLTVKRHELVPELGGVCGGSWSSGSARGRWRFFSPLRKVLLTHCVSRVESLQFVELFPG